MVGSVDRRGFLLRTLPRGVLAKLVSPRSRPNTDSVGDADDNEPPSDGRPPRVPIREVLGG